jgi:hypothetical protein
MRTSRMYSASAAKLLLRAPQVGSKRPLVDHGGKRRPRRHVIDNHRAELSAESAVTNFT